MSEKGFEIKCLDCGSVNCEIQDDGDYDYEFYILENEMDFQYPDNVMVSLIDIAEHCISWI